MENKAIPRLHEVFADHFRIGAAVNPRTIVQSKDLLTVHFNSITAENEMKFERLQPAEGEFMFEEADRLVRFARENGMHMRGHTLVWHNQTPDWVFEDKHGGPVDKETLFARMKAHIETVVGRYKADIDCWDVVNEAVADGGDALLRESRWTKIAGDEFIAKAFEYAHEADPDAKLFYNDYNESDPVKRDKIIRLVQSLLNRGVPIHGIGLQAHWSLYHPSLDDIRQAIEKYAALGLRLHITEMDVSHYAFDDRRADLAEPTPEMQERFAERYEQFFDLFREYKAHIDSVTFWGVDDSYTWLSHFPVRSRKNWPLLFDANQQPKEAFWRVVKS